MIIDQNLKPWVLEVNVLPSLSSSSAFDKRIKTMVVCDALNLIGIRGIKIVDSKQAVSNKEGILASRYIMNPHLIN